MGKFMFVSAFCIGLFILSDILIMSILSNIEITLLVVSIIFVIIYAKTGNRFEIKK
ncbi:MAG: hypothetical protein E6940_08430 [Clostridium septicum]|nr:hypothetical protein [Clostridium septicum]